MIRALDVKDGEPANIVSCPEMPKTMYSRECEAEEPGATANIAETKALFWINYPPAHP